MYEKETTIINKTGLHARPASEFTKLASRFEAEITVKNLNTGKEGNAKSIIAVMSMCMAKGTPVAIAATGSDERNAVDELVALIDTGFEEVDA